MLIARYASVVLPGKYIEILRIASNTFEHDLA